MAATLQLLRVAATAQHDTAAVNKPSDAGNLSVRTAWLCCPSRLLIVPPPLPLQVSSLLCHSLLACLNQLPSSQPSRCVCQSSAPCAVSAVVAASILRLPAMSSASTATASESKTASSAAGGKTKETKDEVDLLDEDDEFEEFQQDTWTAASESAADASLWGDNWDDDDVDDQFIQQLRQQIKQTSEMKD